MARENDKGLRHYGLLALVLLAGLALTFSATRESVRTAQQQALSEFRMNAELYADRVQGRLRAGLTAAQDLYAYYRESETVSPDTFRRLVKTNSNLNSNRRFVAITYGIAKEREAPFVQALRQLGLENYTIYQPRGAQDVEAADSETAPRRQFPLLYTWAGDPENSARLSGLNIGADGRMNWVLEAAIKVEGPSALFLIPFVELDGGLEGQVLMLNPFLSRQGSEGLIVQLVDFEGMLKTVGSEILDIEQRLSITAQTTWGSHGHAAEFGDSPTSSSLTSFQPYVSEFKLGIADWVLTVRPKPLAYPVDYGSALITVSVCLLLTGLFFFIVWSQLRRAKRVADIVNRRTRALKEAHDELEEHYKLLQNLNKDVEDSRRSAELANRAKSEFLATMSHELRTPLNAILGFSQLLREQALGPIGDERYIEYSKDIHSSGSHLLSLINDILDLAKLEAGKVDIEKKAISTRLLSERVMSLLSQQAENKGIELHAEFDDNMPDMILGDELRLRQILINLCSNAIKFTHEGSVVARFFAKPFKNGRQGWVLEVQDTGIGIPEEKQATLFDRFTQVDTALSRRHGGVGLGLAICRELVDRMEGRISVRSMVNVGTAIRVHLPLDEAAADSPEDDMII